MYVQEVCSLVFRQKTIVTIKKINDIYSWHVDLNYLATSRVVFNDVVALSEGGFPFLQSAQRHALYWISHELKLPLDEISVDVRTFSRKMTTGKRPPAFISTVRQVGAAL